MSILFCDQPLKGAIFTDTDKGGVPNVSHYSGPELWRQTAQRQSVSMRLYIYKHTKYTTSSACLHKHLILALLASQQNGQELFHRVFWHCYPRRCRCFSFFFWYSFTTFVFSLFFLVEPTHFRGSRSAFRIEMIADTTTRCHERRILGNAEEPKWLRSDSRLPSPPKRTLDDEAAKGERRKASGPKPKRVLNLGKCR